MKEENMAFFPEKLLREIKARFHHIDSDVDGRSRLYFDNAGGSFRLKAAVETVSRIAALPDCPARDHACARYLSSVQQLGEDDVRTIFNVEGGTVYAARTASAAMFDMVRAVLENIPGGNAVTTILEHPSSFDAMSHYTIRAGMELHVAPSNAHTGGVDVDDIVSLVDSNTVLLSVMGASNISGAKFDLDAIVARARAKNPEIYIIVDAVQHAPHALIDLRHVEVDGINFAPYKFFGCRGVGLSWLSPRAALLPHHRLADKPLDSWELGSPDPAQLGVVSDIVDYVAWIGAQFANSKLRREAFAEGMNRIELHERALLSRLLNGHAGRSGLRQIGRVKVHWDHDALSMRDLIVGIGFRNLDATSAVREYEKRGVIVYERVASSLYSARMLDSFGIDGIIRISPLHCHSPADIDHFLDVTEAVSMIATTARA